MKKFEKAEMEVIRFAAMDILTTSGTTAPVNPIEPAPTESTTAPLTPIDPNEGDIV